MKRNTQLYRIKCLERTVMDLKSKRARGLIRLQASNVPTIWSGSQDARFWQAASSNLTEILSQKARTYEL